MSFVADLTALVAASVDHRHCCPDGWSRVPLGSVAKIINGFPFKSSGFGDVGYPVIRIRDVNRGYTTTRFDGDAPNGFWVEAGDLIVGMDGDFQTAFWRSDRALLNQRVCKIVPDGAQIDHRYLAYILPGYLELINANTPSVTVKHLSSRTLASIPLPLPPLEQQKRIADRIDELFAEVDNGEAALAQARHDLATWRKSLFKAAVTGELTADWRAVNLPKETGADLLEGILADRRARWDGKAKNRGKRYPLPVTPDVDALPSLPVGWCWATMDQLSWASGYGTSEKCSAEHAGTPILRIPNVRRGIISLADLKYTAAPLALNDSRELSIGDLLIVRTNGSDDLIGRAALVLTPPPKTMYFASYLIRLRLLGTVDVLHWVALLIDSPIFRASVLQSIASSAGQYNLSLSKIETFAVPVPPLDEIRAVISRLHAAQADAADGAQSLDAASLTSATLRQSILAAAFRGDLT